MSYRSFHFRCNRYSSNAITLFLYRLQLHRICPCIKKLRYAQRYGGWALHFDTCERCKYFELVWLIKRHECIIIASYVKVLYFLTHFFYCIKSAVFKSLRNINQDLFSCKLIQIINLCSFLINNHIRKFIYLHVHYFLSQVFIYVSFSNKNRLTCNR